jgi:CxxC motif-containing protein (DUF1111 family)
MSGRLRRRAPRGHFAGALAVAAVGCGGGNGCGDSRRVHDPAAARLGGDTTVFDSTLHAFDHVAHNASESHKDSFHDGRSFTHDNWVIAPSSTSGRDGLGPLFNARACVGCHVGNGRGRPPLEPAERIAGLLFRLSVAGDPPTPEPTYGGQLQPYSNPGIPREALPVIRTEERPASYPDGTPYSLLVPSYAFEQLGYGPMVPGTMISPRVAPQLVGMGLLELVPEAALVARADPDDADGDGISGRVRHLSAADGSRAIGRFGWKAGQPSVREQTAVAFAEDIGITTTIHPLQNCTAAQAQCASAISGGDPELPDQYFDYAVAYASLLAVPARRDLDDPVAERGEQLFDSIGCSACHTPRLETGASESFPELAHQVIHPMTDLLLHDMGPGLADGRPEGDASGSEWRTPPLWGIGLLQTVSRHTRLLHDGRARNAEEAILWHGGEAEGARERFRALSAAERAALLRFLETL